ncbi:uncharacterized protein CEXT_14001 [Caerostris extrusa]|uniref:Uncharacterized protein n=1 Tax=Caerostris extrusa TaxID=172846 RepID=A0AAV4ME56_CAEEX|nr:uncharacterized protein CEXT_14001 [Caerostris extrusa]
MIKTAASCCPSLKVLEMLVYHKDGLQYLNCLYNLTFLCLDFKVCEESYLDTLLSTLNEIGHQLKHLSINDERPRRMPVEFPIDGICDRCVNVESLQIKGLCTFIDPLEDGSGIRRLRRLYIGDIKSKDLLLLLKCCLNLTELRVKNFPDFSNSEVRTYFRIHSFWNLRKLCIFNCNLSHNSLKTLLEAFKKLEKVFFPKFLYNVSILDELNREVKFVDNLDKFHDVVSGFNSCKFNDFIYLVCCIPEIYYPECFPLYQENKKFDHLKIKNDWK